MEFAPTPIFYIVIGLLIGLVIGWVAGFFDSNARVSKKIESAEANAEMKIKQAEQKLALASQSSQNIQDDPGLLRLKKSEGRYTLEMDGALMPGELSQDRRKRLIELITVFRLWLEAGQSAPPVSKPATPTQTLSPQQGRTTPDSAAQVPASRVAQPSTQPLSPVKKPEAEKNMASLSIVQQIDSVLQARLIDTPMAKRGIRLQESIQGGVEVYVGLNKFHAVDDVPDEEIKAVIRGAIAEWEKKFTPGL
jgi:hypothetical protein